jgi:GAF domain-containing protein
MRSQLRANNNHSAWDQCQLRSSALFRATGHSPTRSDPNIELPVAQGDPIQVADLSEGVRSAVNNVILRTGFRALLVAPLIRGEDVVGMLVVPRRTPGAFAQSTIDLIKTFAAQSAVAIENALIPQC